VPTAAPGDTGPAKRRASRLPGRTVAAGAGKTAVAPGLAAAAQAAIRPGLNRQSVLRKAPSVLIRARTGLGQGSRAGAAAARPIVRCPAAKRSASSASCHPWAQR